MEGHAVFNGHRLCLLEISRYVQRKQVPRFLVHEVAIINKEVAEAEVNIFHVKGLQEQPVQRQPRYDT